MQDFIFHASYFKAISELPAKDRLKAYEAICNYGVNGIEIEGLKGSVKAILNIVKPIISSEQKRREILAQNGAKGGRPKKTNRFLNEKPNEKPIGYQSKNLTTNTNTILETSNDVSCSEPKNDSEPKKAKQNQLDNLSPVFIELPLNDGSMFPVHDDQVKEFKDLYGNVDVDQQLKNMKGWLTSNPSRRKTKKGIMRFINSWLASEQDKGSRSSNYSYGNSSKNKGYGTSRDQASIDAAESAIWQSCEEILKNG